MQSARWSTRHPLCQLNSVYRKACELMKELVLYLEFIGESPAGKPEHSGNRSDYLFMHFSTTQARTEIAPVLLPPRRTGDPSWPPRNLPKRTSAIVGGC